MLNPQQPFGADVITRISTTMMDPDALDRLAALARQALHAAGHRGLRGRRGRAGRGLRDRAGRQRDDDAHRARHRPGAARRGPVRDDRADLHRHPGRRHRACACTPARAPTCSRRWAPTSAATSWPARWPPGMDRDKRTRLFIDVGTNCEIVLAHGDRLLATAAPAGPAFEGAAIRCGMRAAPGAIEGVKISDEDVSLQVIGDVEPVGLCGSGLVDAVAALVQAGLLDASGRLLDAETAARTRPGLAERLRKVGEERVFVLHWAGGPGRHGRRDLPLPARRARAAVRQGGHRHRLAAADRGGRRWPRPTSSRCCWPARSAATWPRPARSGSGWCPDIPTLRIVSAGNVAGEGAKMALLSVRERAAARALLEEVHYVELSDRPDFNDRFVDQLSFPVPESPPTGWPWWPAGPSPGTSARSPSGAAGRSTCTRCRRCCTTDPDRIAGAVEAAVGRAARAVRRGRGRVRRLRQLRRARRACAPGSGWPGCPGRTATTCSPGPSGCASCCPTSPAPTC